MTESPPESTGPSYAATPTTSGGSCCPTCEPLLDVLWEAGQRLHGPMANLGMSLACAGALEYAWSEGCRQAAWVDGRPRGLWPGYQMRYGELVLTDPHWVGRSPWEWEQLLAYRAGKYSWLGREEAYLEASG